MSGLIVTPTLNGVTASVYAALVPFIVAVTGLPATSVIQGLQNRAAMPLPGFIAVQALTRHRLRTNLHDYSVAGAGNVNIQEGVELAVQIDCYGPSGEDWATMLSSTLRDEYGCNALAPSGVQPLYADDARMIPLVAGEEQYEERWSLDAHFQYNPTTTALQQYAAVLALGLIDVDVEYPPA